MMNKTQQGLMIKKFKLFIYKTTKEKQRIAVVPDANIPIEVSVYMPKHGGFMKPIELLIDTKLAKKLTVGNYKSDKDSYWDAVRQIKGTIAGMAGISSWGESWKERTLLGDVKAPVQINTIKRIVPVSNQKQALGKRYASLRVFISKIFHNYNSRYGN